MTQRKIPGKTVEVLDDEDVRRRVLDGELVAMPTLGAAAVDPLVTKRLRELARRSLRGRGSPQT